MGRRSVALFLLGLLLLAFFPDSVFSQSRGKNLDEGQLFREGEELLSKGEVERALWRFKRLIAEHPKSPLIHEAKFRMGLCYTQLKRPKEALRILNELLPTFMTPQRMVQVFTLLGDNALEIRDRAQALSWYEKGLQVSGQPQEELKRKIRAIIDSMESEEELNEVEWGHRGTYAGGYAKWRLAQKAKQSGYEAIAKKLVAEVEREYSRMDYVAQRREGMEAPPPPNRSKYHVGVLLPLSGIHKPFGHKALQAIQLAFKEKGSKEKLAFASLMVRDTKGEPAEVEKGIDELVRHEKAIAVIGPLLSLEVDRAARKARELKVPLISLSQKGPMEGRGDFVFQNSLTPEDQVQTLVAFAIQELELRSFAVFYPNSPYGHHFKNLFHQEVGRRGGRVVGTVIYQEDQTDFRQEIRGFFRVETLPKQGEGKRAEAFKQGVFVDGLFVPDSADRAGTILGQLAYYEIRGTTFLGTNAWNGPDLVKMGGRGAEGAFFVDAFSKTPSVKSFVEEFLREYQREPDTLEALAFDGANLLRKILQTKSPSSPQAVRDELLRSVGFEGVSGLKGFNGEGKAIRVLSILRVKNGRIEHFSP
ncbi:MAG: ABC transporter substrate-binding protein [Desulfobacterota bacterium]|nr:ABC transporter substrate-binding protein [Thermodesulfobacteriota bacterium]